MMHVRRGVSAFLIALLAYAAVGISNSSFFDPVFGSLDTLKRDKSVSSKECQSLRDNPKQLVATNNVESELANDAWRCSLQYHELKNSSDAYHLAFLEFNDEGKHRSKHQIEDLRKHLSSGKHIVITYTHGWRHDAHLDGGDVQNFRVMLAYARQFLSQRCREDRRFCDHKLTGIFVAWNGRARVNCQGQRACAVLAMPSLYFRKATSDAIAGPITKSLEEIDGFIKARNVDLRANTQPSKMLVTGHSLGGNILARGVRDRFVEAVSKHKPRTRIPSVLGDLVVLFNPASAARNWVAIQSEVQKRYGVDRTRFRFGADDASAYNSHIFFPLSQKPVYVSLTSACHWPDFVKTSGLTTDLNRQINCDTATYYLFHAFRWLRGNRGEQETIAIGHLEPTDKCGLIEPGQPVQPPKSEWRPVNFGTTHELEIGSPATSNVDRYTDYENAMEPLTSRCDTGAGWLYRVKQHARYGKNSASRAYWDGGAKPSTALHWMNRELRLRIQFRHSIYRGFSGRKGCGAYNITTANDPFWNVRALDSAVKEHGRFSSYPTWCAINQLLLDDVNAKDAPFVFEDGTAWVDPSLAGAP